MSLPEYLRIEKVPRCLADFLLTSYNTTLTPKRAARVLLAFLFAGRVVGEHGGDHFQHTGPTHMDGRRQILAGRACHAGNAVLQAGSSDYSGFCRAFKREFGISPRQYRGLH